MLLNAILALAAKSVGSTPEPYYVKCRSIYDHAVRAARTSADPVLLATTVLLKEMNPGADFSAAAGLFRFNGAGLAQASWWAHLRMTPRFLLNDLETWSCWDWECARIMGQ